MKPLWLKIHLYAGLFALPYLLVFGLSAVNINHEMFTENLECEAPQTAHVYLPDSTNNEAFADALRDSLHLMGWCPFWQEQWEGRVFTFNITNPGSDYKLSVNTQTSIVTYQRRPKGFWPTVNALHFFGGIIPNGSAILRPWGLYQTFTVIYLLTAVCTGIYLFIRNTRERLIGWLVVGGTTILSLSLMLYVWLIG